MQTDAYKQIDERTALAKETLRQCRLCPHECSVDRTKGQLGFCKLDDSFRCFREMIYRGEEAGLNPSHQIYFAGCNMKCEFCSVAEWNEDPEAAQILDIDFLASQIESRRNEGAKTLNLLGGEPAISVYSALKLLSRVDPSTCVVWNSSMYYNPIVDELMAGLVDIYLADLKCGNDKCSKSLLGCEDYFEVAKQNIISAEKHSKVIVRHLILPGHFECCTKPVMTWFSQNLSESKLSLRSDYTPPAGGVSCPKVYLSREELKNATNFATKLDLDIVE